MAIQFNTVSVSQSDLEHIRDNIPTVTENEVSRTLGSRIDVQYNNPTIMTPTAVNKTIAAYASVAGVLGTIGFTILYIQTALVTLPLFLGFASAAVTVGSLVYFFSAKDYDDPAERGQYISQNQNSPLSTIAKQHKIDNVINYKLLGDLPARTYAVYRVLANKFIEIDSEYTFQKDRIHLVYSNQMLPYRHREANAHANANNIQQQNQHNNALQQITGTPPSTLANVGSSIRTGLAIHEEIRSTVDRNHADRVYGTERDRALQTLKTKYEESTTLINQIFNEVRQN